MTRPSPQSGAIPTALELWGLAFACLAPVAIVAEVMLWIARHHTTQPFRMFEAALLLVEWSIWVALAPLIVGLVWRVPLNSGRWLRGLGTHLVAGALLALGEMALFIVIARAFGGYPRETFVGAYWRMLALWYPYALLVYWVIAVAAHAALEARRARAREVEAAQLREQLTAAQLDALKMQLHPHFLCNTLNTVAVFLRDGHVEQAGAIVTGLGELLHTALDRMDTQEVSLRDELTFARQYLEIERIRFSDRMRVEIDADARAMDALVPVMILQPVVENAVRHGISRDPRSGRVWIRARRHDGQLDLSVEDDGPGLRPNTPSDGGHGVGLLNARMRLDRLYGDAAQLHVANGETRGVVVQISLPYRTGDSLSPPPAARPG